MAEEHLQRAYEVVELIAEGMSAKKACEQVEGISRTQFYKLILNNKELENKYARAMELRAKAMFDDLEDMASEDANDITTDDKGNSKTNHEAIQRSKLKVDTRKWVLSRMNPRKYGDRVNIDHDAENKGTPPKVIWSDESNS